MNTEHTGEVQTERGCGLLTAGFFPGPAGADYATAHYIANEGVMVVHGETKILFDPLFTNSYGNYTLPSKEIREALIAGTPPYAGVDAVFVSHYHGDHFSPEDILSMLKAQDQLQVYAPNQVVSALRKAATEDDTDVFTRVRSIRLK